MQAKRSKRSRIRAAKPTGGKGHKKKNRGAGHRGGRGDSGSGKRGSAKIMKVTKGEKYLGKYGFKSLAKKERVMNLATLQESLASFVEEGKAKQDKGVFEVDLSSLGYTKLLSKGDVSKKMHIKVDTATDTAISKIEKAGGKVDILVKKTDENIDN